MRRIFVVLSIALTVAAGMDALLGADDIGDSLGNIAFVLLPGFGIVAYFLRRRRRASREIFADEV